MNELIRIENKEIRINEFKEQRILTAWDIARLHEREVREVTQQFERNRKRLLPGIDYFTIPREKISESQIVIQDFVPNNVKEIQIFTESGYLMLVKTFEDDLSWHIQRDLVKNYFRNINNTPKTFKEALFLAYKQAEKIEKLETENKVQAQQIAELQPKASYYDLVLQCKNLLSTTEISKDYGMSAKTLNKLLNEYGVQYKQSGIWFLYQKYASYGYTQTKTNPITRSNGKIDAVPHMYWTQKGRLFLYNFLKDKGIFPLIEIEEAGA